MLDAVYDLIAFHIDKQYIAVLAHYFYDELLVYGKAQLVDGLKQYLYYPVVLVLQNIRDPGGAQMLSENHAEYRRNSRVFRCFVYKICSGMVPGCRNEKSLLSVFCVKYQKKLLRLGLVDLFYLAQKELISEFFYRSISDHAVKGHICFLLLYFVV